MSGGGTKAKSTSTSISGSAQPWATPLATQGANDVLSVFNAQQPKLNALQDNLTGQLGNLQTQGQAYGQTAGQANDYYGKVLSGGYLKGNPYINNILSTMDQQIRNNVNSGFEGAGRYGSGAYVGELAKQIGNANGQVLYGNYQDEMARMAQAAQGAQAAQIANNQQQLAATGVAAQLPYTGVESMASSLGALFNGGTSSSTSTQKQGNNWLGAIGAVGAGLASNPAVGAAIFSDRRLKKNIEKVGEAEDGLGIYDYDYKKGHGLPKGHQRGVMADEVAEHRPWALGPRVGRYATVDYGKL